MSKSPLNLCDMTKEDIFKTCNLGRFSDESKTNFSEWFTGEDGADKDIIEARQQAVQSYPLFAYEIYKIKKIREAVEQKKPLAPALAKLYKVDEKRLKRIQGKTYSDLQLKSIHDLYDIFRLKERNFQLLKNNLLDLAIIKKYAFDIYQMPVNDFLDYLSLQNSNLSQYIERMKENSTYDVNDALKFLYNKLFYPATLNKVKNYAEKNNLIWYSRYFHLFDNKKILKEQTNIKAVFDFSERYHRNLFRWEDMFNFDSGMKYMSWQPMFGKIDLGNGWSAKELNSISSLKDQGRQENHCVGGYVKSILEGNKDSARLILSLEKEGEVKSTIDMLCSKNEEKNRLDVKIQQNRAHSNKDPSQEALNFSNLLVNKIKSEAPSKLDIYLYNLRHAQKEYQKYQTDNKYVAECGYNPWDRDILQNVWDEFKPALPKKLRRLGLDGLIEMMAIDVILFRDRKNDSELNIWERQENTEQDQVDHVEDGVRMDL